MSGSLTTGHAVEVVWDQFESTLRALYLEQNLTLEEVRTEMARTYQFNASKAQYERQFNKWNFRKNWTAKEWKILAHKIMQRGREHKDSEVLVNGKPMNPKKLRKETLRYRSRSGGTEIRFQAPLPPTPEGFIIRTPSPKFTASTSLTSASAPLWDVPPLINTNPMYFYPVYPVLHQVNMFSRMPDLVRSTLLLLSQDIYSTIIEGLKTPSGEKLFESFNQTVEALMPENTFRSNDAISQNQESPIVDVLKLTLYLVSNNFFKATSRVSDKIYEWIKQCSGVGLMQYLFSVRGPIAEAFWENLFRLAIDAQDASTVKKMMDLGVNPNEQVCLDRWGRRRTPVQEACRLRSLKLVRVLVDGGAKVDLSASKIGDESALVNALYSSKSASDNENGNPMHLADPELVRILLRAGAIINPSFGESPLVHAAKSGHVEAVGLLVSAGADVSGSNAHIYALKCKNHIPDRDVISMTRILLKAGANPNLTFQTIAEHTTALRCAMHRNCIELIQLLLDYGARVTENAFTDAAQCCDVNIARLLFRFGGQVTEKVIRYAVRNDDPKLLRFLLEAADEETEIRGKNAALIEALAEGKMDLVDWLDAKGARLERRSNVSYAIRRATERGDLLVLRLLLDGKSKFRARNINPVDQEVLIAIKARRNDIVELLLESGGKVPNYIDKFESALLVAARLKDPHLMRKLLAAGAARETNHIYNKRTTSVLPTVVKWGHYPLIQEMINAGVDINGSEIHGSKASLAVAVENRDPAIIELLINAGADVNAPSDSIYGGSALEAACQNDDLHMVQKLLDLGAEPDEWSLIAAVPGSLELVQTLLDAHLSRYKRFSKGFGCRALQHAIQLKKAAMIEILLNKGIDANTIVQHMVEGADHKAIRTVIEESALGYAIRTDRSNDPWIIQMLLRNGATPNSIVRPDETAILAAIRQNNLALVEMLIVAGADINLSIEPGVTRTPLQLTAEKGHIHIAKLLLAKGANVNAPPYARYGATALQFAAIGGFVGLANLLLENGADVNASPAKTGGRTALEGAAEHGRIEMLQLLLDAGAEIIGPGSEQYESARELAIENGYFSAKRLLEKHMAEKMEALLTWDPTSMDFGSVDLGSMDLYSLDHESTAFGVSDGFRF